MAARKMQAGARAKGGGRQLRRARDSGFCLLFRDCSLSQMGRPSPGIVEATEDLRLP